VPEGKKPLREDRRKEERAQPIRGKARNFASVGGQSVEPAGGGEERKSGGRGGKKERIMTRRVPKRGQGNTLILGV